MTRGVAPQHPAIGPHSITCEQQAAPFSMSLHIFVTSLHLVTSFALSRLAMARLLRATRDLRSHSRLGTLPRECSSKAWAWATVPLPRRTAPQAATALRLRHTQRSPHPLATEHLWRQRAMARLHRR